MYNWCICCLTGSDVVDWLFHHVEGFADRREARKYASNLLKASFIRHTVNKITFSEQCYYIFGDLSGSKYFYHYSSATNGNFVKKRSCGLSMQHVICHLRAMVLNFNPLTQPSYGRVLVAYFILELPA